VLRNWLPFEVWAPNAETKRAIEELESGGGERFEGGTNELLGHLRGRRRENIRYGRMSDMKKDDVKAVLGRVLTWPAEAQKEAVATLRAIEEEWVSGDYTATPEELEAIDDADRSGAAREDEVEAAFSTFRTA
jgi:hypothetical protein